MYGDSKYVAFSGLDGNESIVVFPKEINHDQLAMAVRKAHYKSNKEARIIVPVSAGFVNDNLGCYGRSETLDLDAREEDTTLLAKQLRRQ